MTTEKFLLEFGFESLRDLPGLEALMDAGLMSADVGAGVGDREAEKEGASEGLPRREISRDQVA